MAPVASPSNPFKRHIDAVQRVYDCAKRLKTNNESSPSPPPTLSEQSILIPAAAPENTVEASEAESEDSWVSESSEESSDESDLEESDEGSAADEDNDDDDDDDEEQEEEGGEQDDQGDQGEVGEEQVQDAIVNLPANRGEKPTYKLHEEDEVDDIRSFLKDFIPKLKAANEELEAQKEAGTLQTTEIIGEGPGDSEEQYIEMNLGLGVLEEKPEDTDEAVPGSSSGEDNSDEEGTQGKETDILRKLMGQDKMEEPVGIEEIAETPTT